MLGRSGTSNVVNFKKLFLTPGAHIAAIVYQAC